MREFPSKKLMGEIRLLIRLDFRQSSVFLQYPGQTNHTHGYYPNSFLRFALSKAAPQSFVSSEVPHRYNLCYFKSAVTYPVFFPLLSFSSLASGGVPRDMQIYG